MGQLKHKSKNRILSHVRKEIDLCLKRFSRTQALTHKHAIPNILSNGKPFSTFRIFFSLVNQI